MMVLRAATCPVCILYEKISQTGSFAGFALALRTKL